MKRSALAVSLLLLLSVALPISGQDAGVPAHTGVFQTVHGGPALHVSQVVRTGVQPKSVDVSPDGTRVVVCNFGFADHDNVYVYDAISMERVGVLTFPGNAVETVFTRDGHTLYVSNFRRHVVEVFDFAACASATPAAPCALSPRAEVTTARHPKFMALSPDERTLYVADWGDRSVSVVDTATLQEVRRLPTERHPRGLAVRPDGTLLAAAFDGNVIHVFPSGASRERALGGVRVPAPPRPLAGRAHRLRHVLARHARLLRRADRPPLRHRHAAQEPAHDRHEQRRALGRERELRLERRLGRRHRGPRPPEPRGPGRGPDRGPGDPPRPRAADLRDQLADGRGLRAHRRCADAASRAVIASRP